MDKKLKFTNEMELAHNTNSNDTSSSILSNEIRTGCVMNRTHYEFIFASSTTLFMLTLIIVYFCIHDERRPSEFDANSTTTGGIAIAKNKYEYPAI